MSKHSIRTPFPTGDFVSARAARRFTAHPRTAARPEPPQAPTRAVNPPPAAEQSSPSPASGPTVLRRWSVAELIARAAAGPSVVV